MNRKRRALSIVGTAAGLVFIWMFCFMFFIILRNGPEGINISMDKYGTGWLIFGFAIVNALAATYTLLDKFTYKYKTSKKKVKTVEKQAIPKAIMMDERIRCPKCAKVFEIPTGQQLVTCPYCNTKGKR